MSARKQYTITVANADGELLERYELSFDAQGMDVATRRLAKALEDMIADLDLIECEGGCGTYITSAAAVEIEEFVLCPACAAKKPTCQRCGAPASDREHGKCRNCGTLARGW